MARPSERTDPVLHNRLAVFRAERGLSRQELAAALGVNYQTIGYLERGEYNPSLDLALRAAEYFSPVEYGDGRFNPCLRATPHPSPPGAGP